MNIYENYWNYKLWYNFFVFSCVSRIFRGLYIQNLSLSNISYDVRVRSGNNKLSYFVGISGNRLAQIFFPFSNNLWLQAGQMLFGNFTLITENFSMINYRNNVSLVSLMLKNCTFLWLNIVFRPQGAQTSKRIS